MDIAKEVLSSSDSLDWSFVASKRDVSIFSRQVADESVQQVKAVTVINAGLENILSHLTNPNRRRGKKDAVFESKLISTDESTKSQVLYRAQKMPWPLKVRDFVLNSRVIKKTNGTAIWAVWSTTHPDYPVRDDRIRAWCKNSSWIISPITSYKSNVIYIAQVDLQGSIPTKIKNKFMTQEAMWVADVSRYFQRQLNRQLKDDGSGGGGNGSGGEGEGSSSSGNIKGGGSGGFVGLWNGLRRKSSTSKSLAEISGGGGGGGEEGRESGGSFEWKPLSKNSREYFQEIVNTDSQDQQTLDKKSTNSGDSKEYKWKKLQRSSREYFKEMFGRGGGDFDPSDYERTPPASPAMPLEGGVGKDVVEASLSLPKLVKNIGLGRRNSSDRGLDHRRPSVSSDVVSVRSLKAISPSASRDYGSGGSKYGKRDGSFFYDNPKSDMSAGGASAHSGHSSGGRWSDGGGGSRVYGGSESGASHGAGSSGRGSSEYSKKERKNDKKKLEPIEIKSPSKGSSGGGNRRFSSRHRKLKDKDKEEVKDGSGDDGRRSRSRSRSRSVERRKHHDEENDEDEKEEEFDTMSMQREGVGDETIKIRKKEKN
ncbi:hypothetical protein TrVE_jg5860 [Triparma verrucosa]|uniref:START domain-containing protein n=1 Tax=Triparma verrucosa TaxID=1606542 RepID=A0A9W7FEX6_9STRA|nr:hypothetical protein TrVE_jg5860 [Triparma verrucosa]